MSKKAAQPSGARRPAVDHSVVVVMVESGASLEGWLAQLPSDEADVRIIGPEAGEGPAAFCRRARRTLESLACESRRVRSVLLGCAGGADSSLLEARISLLLAAVRLSGEVVLAAGHDEPSTRYQLEALALTLREQGASAMVRVLWVEDAPTTLAKSPQVHGIERALHRAA